MLKPILEILAGIPSVVLGFFALTWISPEIVQRVQGDATQSNLLAAGIGVGILSIPLVASVSEDARSRILPSSPSPSLSDINHRPPVIWWTSLRSRTNRSPASLRSPRFVCACEPRSLLPSSVAPICGRARSHKDIVIT